MINFDNVTKEETEKHNPNWPQVPDHPHRILLIGGSGSRKTNLLFNIISQQPNIYWHAKYPYKAKYHFLIKKRKSTGLRHLDESKTFIEYSNNVDNIYQKYWRMQPK